MESLTPSLDKQNHRQHQINRVTWIGAAMNLALSAVKVLMGIFFHSHALLVDGIHSLSDLATDILVIGASRLANKQPDKNHPYGHQRYETFAVILLGGFLIMVAGGFVFESITRLLDPDTPQAPGWPVLLGAISSILAKEWLFFYTRACGNKIKSQLLIANAWHHRSDSLSSIVVLAGTLFALAGYTRFDALAAAAVALLIAWIGCKLIWQKIQELTESTPIPEELAAIENLILGTSGVRGIHDLRCRRLGSDIFMDLHLEVTPTITVSEGHQIGDWVATRIMAHYEEIKDVIVHIDYETDGLMPLETPDHLLPLRDQIIVELTPFFEQSDDFLKLLHFNVHYLKNEISIELFLPLSTLPNQKLHRHIINQFTQSSTVIKTVNLWYGDSNTSL